MVIDRRMDQLLRVTRLVNHEYLLDYDSTHAHAHTEANILYLVSCILYYASDMQLKIYSDASYLPVPTSLIQTQSQ
jgi:hypothetical protein